MKKIITGSLAILLTATLGTTTAFGRIPDIAGPGVTDTASVSTNSATDNSPADVTAGTGEPAAVPGDTRLTEPETPVRDEKEPSADTASSSYSISGTTLTVNAVSGSDITKALNEALLYAGDHASAGSIYTVKVPAGSYTLSGCLNLFSNTTLSMYGATITSDSSKSPFNMLVLGTGDYVNSSACAGYTGFSNITVLGGTFVSASNNEYVPIRLTHADNITFKDFTIGGSKADHLIEAVAINNFMVDGCTFQNMSASTRNGVREALQLDIATHSVIYPDIYHDGTMMKNVTIQNCTFSNVSRGIGSHSQLLNAYHENIKIINNTFENLEKECIVGLNYRNVEISGNVMTNCGGGILLQTSKEDSDTIYTTTQEGKKAYTGTLHHDMQTSIHNNKIQTTYTKWADGVTAIKITGRRITKAEKNKNDNGTIPAGDYYISGVNIYDNEISTAGYGIVLKDAKNCSITNNSITGTGYSSKDSYVKNKKYNGIHFGEASTGNLVKDNTIKSSLSNGIYMQDKSSASEITGNKISDSGHDGMNLTGGSGVTGSITGNTISNSGEQAVFIHSGSSVGGNIQKNSISGCGKNGINIYDKTIISGNIDGNTIKKSALNGINVTDSSTVKGSITGNQVSDSKKTGIQVNAKSSVNGSLTGNTVTNSTTNGICVIASSRVGKDIAENTVSSSLKTGVNVYQKSTVSGSISKNKISASTVNGICVGESSTVKGHILQNTVSDTKKTGIQISSKSVISGKIKGNTVSKSTVNGICASGSSKIKKGIEGNKIKTAKKYGIFISDKAVVSRDIVSNTISSSNTPLVFTSNAGGNVRKNTFQKNTNNYTRVLNTKIKVKTQKNSKFTSASGKGKKISLKWKKVKGVSGYCIELSTRADFSKISKKVDTKSLKTTFKKLKKGQTYYVRICTYTKSGKITIYSDYSKAKKVKVS